MKPTLAIIVRDLRKFFRNPALIVTSLVLPLVQLIIIGNAFGGKVRNVPVGLVDLDHGSEALVLRQRFQAIDANAGTFRITAETPPDRALEAVRRGEIAAAIVVPEDYSRSVKQRMRPKVGLVVDNTDPFVVTTVTEKMAEVVESVNAPDLAPRQPSAASLDVVEIYPYIEYIQYLLPGSITLAIAAACLLGGGLLYIDDKMRGIHEGYLSTPITRIQLTLGMIIAGTVKAGIVGMIVVLAGALLAGIGGVFQPRILLLLCALVLLTAFALISMISALVVRVKDAAAPRATFGILSTLLFFPSGAMYPISGFPEWLKAVAVVDPYTYSVHGFRSILLKGVGLQAIQTDVLALFVFSIVFLVGVFLLFPRHL
ncbi:MAG: ABC transporter permease [Bryobacteraceae bacterium]